MKKTVLLALAVALVFPIVSGCVSKTDSKSVSSDGLKESYIDNSVTQHHSLGWLGATSNPVMESLAFADPADDGRTISPGGIVLREVAHDGIADKSGLEVGDVVICVGGEWLPIKDDPTLDFLMELEARITAGEESIDLGIIRNQEFRTLAVAHGQTSVDAGLPTNVARRDEATTRAIHFLLTNQNEDGSFGGSELSPEDRVRTSSVAGLALLAYGDKRVSDQLDRCLDFVGAEIDKRSKTPEPTESNEDQNPGMIRMTMPDVEIDPLTAAYLLQFVAESKIQMMDKDWMQRIIGLTGAIANSQFESGGWNTALPESGETDAQSVDVDVTGTHTTNQVLLALGSIERKGVMGNSDLLAKACAYLQQQAELRAKENLDRRTRASLSAGTAAALIAINCHPTEMFLKTMTDEGLQRAGDIHSAPGLALPGLLSTALVAFGSDNENWMRFHNNTRVVLGGLQSLDGGFREIPGSRTEIIVGPEMDSCWQAAHFAITVAMQKGNLKRMTGQTTMPMQVARNSAGGTYDGAGSQKPGMPGPPAGAQVMNFSLDDLSGEGSMEDQIKEKLKEMGIDTDNVQMGEIPDGVGKNAGKKDDK